MLSSRAASAAAFLWAKGSMPLSIRGSHGSKFWGQPPELRRVMCRGELPRDGVERSRRFVMLPSLASPDWLSSHSWILLCDASPLELSEEWIVQGGVWSSNRASVTGTSLVITIASRFWLDFATIRAPGARKRVARTRCPSTSACCNVAAAARAI